MFNVNFSENFQTAKNICSEFNNDFNIVLYRSYIYFLSDKIKVRVINNKTCGAREVVMIKNLEDFFKEDEEEKIIYFEKINNVDRLETYKKLNEIDIVLKRVNGESIVFFKKTILLNFLEKNYHTVFKQQRVEVNFIHEFGKIKVKCAPYKRTSIKKSNFQFDSFVKIRHKNKEEKLCHKLEFSCNCFVLKEILSSNFTSNIVAVKHNTNGEISLFGYINHDKVEWIFS